LCFKKKKGPKGRGEEYRFHLGYLSRDSKAEEGEKNRRGEEKKEKPAAIAAYNKSTIQRTLIFGVEWEKGGEMSGGGGGRGCHSLYKVCKKKEKERRLTEGREEEGGGDWELALLSLTSFPFLSQFWCYRRRKEKTEKRKRRGKRK